MNNGLKIQRCNFLPEGEMTIVKDTNTLIHNIVDSELKEKDKEIERLNNIIDELEKWLNEYYESNRKWYNFELSNHDMKYYEEFYRNTEFMIVKFLKQLKKLKEGKKMVGEYMSLETVKKLNREKTLDTDSKLLNANINLSNINQDLRIEIEILKNNINRAVQMLKDNESKEDIIKVLGGK